MVMYAGQQVEISRAAQLFEGPRSLYRSMLDALPERSAGGVRSATISGVVRGRGSADGLPVQSALHLCRRPLPAGDARPDADDEGRQVRCLKPLNSAPAGPHHERANASEVRG